MTFVDWEKLAKNMDVGQVPEVHVANRIALKNTLWKRQILSNKNRSGDGENEVGEPEIKKENLGGLTWTDLIRRVRPPYSAPVLSRKDLHAKRIFHDDFLDAALEKAVLALRAQTGLDYRNVQEEVIHRLLQNRTALRSSQSTIRFLRDASMSGDWFTDCPECDKLNDPGWSDCSHCNFHKES